MLSVLSLSTKLHIKLSITGYPTCKVYDYFYMSSVVKPPQQNVLHDGIWVTIELFLLFKLFVGGKQVRDVRLLSISYWQVKAASCHKHLFT